MMQGSLSNMEWDVGGMPEAPTAPETLQQTGLTIGFLSDLILRTLYTRGGMLGLDLARSLCLPFAAWFAHRLRSKRRHRRRPRAGSMRSGRCRAISPPSTRRLPSSAAPGATCCRSASRRI